LVFRCSLVWPQTPDIEPLPHALRT
jgi:hypothetical protein